MLKLGLQKEICRHTHTVKRATIDTYVPDEVGRRLKGMGPAIAVNFTSSLGTRVAGRRYSLLEGLGDRFVVYL